MIESRIILTTTLLLYTVIIGCSQFQGGISDGFAIGEFNSTLSGPYQGGQNDGFSISNLNSIPVNLFNGGKNDGSTFASVMVGDNFQYHGEYSDGFGLLNHFQLYEWSGSVGSGWNVSGNWNTGQPPSMRHTVVIPSTALNWPGINAGIFVIKKDPTDTGSYFCNELHIEPGAQVLTRINCFIRNYGMINIEGLLRVKNTALDAFINMPEGQIEIINGGILRFEGN